MKIYLNGRILPEEEATVSATDHGFLYGAGFFETFRTFNGRAFLIDEHLKRLKSGCEQIRIRYGNTFLGTEPRMEPVLTELLKANDLPDAAFRYTVSAGPTPGGLPRQAYTAPTELLVPRPLSENDSQPVSLHVLTTRRNSSEFDPRPKSVNYLNSLAGHFELLDRKTAPGDEGIMLSPDGRLCEGVTSNLFLIRDGCVHTPRCTGRILPGVTRQFLLGLARSRRLPHIEGDYTLADMTPSDAVFLTNSVRGLIPVSAVFGAERERIWENDSSLDPHFNKLSRMYSMETLQRCGTPHG